MKTISFVTGNAKKLEEVLKILGSNPPFQLKAVKVDLNEYQGEPDFISEAKCREATRHVEGPLIIEDTSLCLRALNNLPGPYIKWFLDGIGAAGIHRLLTGWQDKSAKGICTIAYCEGKDSPIKLFKGVVSGTIVEPRGSNNFGWDSCFQPDGSDKTYAELDPEFKSQFSHRALAVRQLADYFSGQRAAN